MNSNQAANIMIAHTDPPTFEYPCVECIQAILYNIIPSSVEKESSLERLLEYVISELETTKSAFWFYESYIFEGLAWTVQMYYIDNSDKIEIENKEGLEQCVSLLRFLGKGKENLDSLPSDFNGFDIMAASVQTDIFMRINNRFRNPQIRCPSCSDEFSQFRYDVVRTMYSIKCPKCKQSIGL